MIQFVKTLSYELQPANREVFAYLVDLGLQVVDPPSLEPGQLRLDVSIVLHSPLQRVVQSLATQKHVRYVALPELREVPFDLKQMMTPEIFAQQGDAAVRQAICTGFIADTLPIERAVLLQEARHLLELAARYAQGQTVTVVSHSFRLKLLEAYIRTAGELEIAPQLIRKYIAANTKTYPFGGGFQAKEEEIADTLNQARY